jgi:D-sedoheptulose 7-phosphate isomerase
MNNKELEELIKRYPLLKSIEGVIYEAFLLLKNLYENDGVLYVCGNGGSHADAEHIVGELMKGFKIKRSLPESLKQKFEKKLGKDGRIIAERLEQGLRTISLHSNPALISAFINDVHSDLAYAQQLSVLGRPGDVVLGLTTSGNSSNIVETFKVANVLGIKVIAMTGESGGICSEWVDVHIKVPSTITHVVQEYHLPIYHTLCLMLEAEFYGE